MYPEDVRSQAAHCLYIPSSADKNIAHTGAVIRALTDAPVDKGTHVQPLDALNVGPSLSFLGGAHEDTSLSSTHLS